MTGRGLTSSGHSGSYATSGIFLIEKVQASAGDMGERCRRHG